MLKRTNMKRKTLITAFLLLTAASAQAQTVWHDPMKEAQCLLNGRGWNNETGNSNYCRLPDRMKQEVPPSVWNLSRQTPGVSLRFQTNAKQVWVRYINYFQGKNYPNVVTQCHSGVDLYATDPDGNTTWIPNMMRYNLSVNSSDTVQYYFNTAELPNHYGRKITYELYLPAYNGIKWLAVGTDASDSFHFTEGSQERPIVVYGTSIAHGASASRPGLIWSTRLKRRYECPVINLGFSGNGKMENALFDALAEIDARAYLIDCVPNCADLTSQQYEERLRYGIGKLRSASQAPIVFMEGQFIEHPSALVHNYNFHQQRAKDTIQHRVVDELSKQGVRDLYYITREELGLTADDFIEGVHPNDVGMMKYEAAYAQVLDRVLVGVDTMRHYRPCTQQRDGYDWTERHNRILQRNRETDPEVLMIGNSITHFWGGEPTGTVVNGGKSWDKLFKGHTVTNMGMGWDRVENTFWRLSHGELENCKPREICLMIGTNNGEPAWQVVDGIMDIVGLIRRHQPQARLHVIGIYPKGGREEAVRQLNDLLQKAVKPDDMTFYHDFSEALTLSDGSGQVDPSCFLPDKLHPNAKGYERLSKHFRRILFQ